MGFLDSDNSQNESEELLNQQIQENKAELERKKQDLYTTRLDIIKSQGSQNWEPERRRPAQLGRSGVNTDTTNAPGFIKNIKGITR